VLIIQFLLLTNDQTLFATELNVNLPMKTTLYFNYTRKRQDRAQIKEEWIEFVIENPEKTVIQSDGRIRKWSKITEANKYLRVILLEDGITVHNAFFDRSYKEE
jgi:hypothetical protein